MSSTKPPRNCSSSIAAGSVARSVLPVAESSASPGGQDTSWMRAKLGGTKTAARRRVARLDRGGGRGGLRRGLRGEADARERRRSSYSMVVHPTLDGGGPTRYLRVRRCAPPVTVLKARRSPAVIRRTDAPPPPVRASLPLLRCRTFAFSVGSTCATTTGSPSAPCSPSRSAPRCSPTSASAGTAPVRRGETRCSRRSGRTPTTSGPAPRSAPPSIASAGRSALTSSAPGGTTSCGPTWRDFDPSCAASWTRRAAASRR